MKEESLENFDIKVTSTALNLDRFSADHEELDRMRRMTSRINSSDYLDNLENGMVALSDEMKKFFAFNPWDYLENRQRGPRPEDMLYLMESTSEGTGNGND